MMPTYMVRDALDAEAEPVTVEADSVRAAAQRHAESEYRQDPSGDAYNLFVLAPDGRAYEVCVDVEIEVTFEPMVVREVRPPRSNEPNPPALPAERTRT